MSDTHDIYGDKRPTWHRHSPANIPTTLIESLNRMCGDPWLRQGPFAYCPICKKVPTEFVAKDPT